MSWKVLDIIKTDNKLQLVFSKNGEIIKVNLNKDEANKLVDKIAEIYELLTESDCFEYAYEEGCCEDCKPYY